MNLDNPSETYDYLIVGAGAAGCVVASRLSENHGVSVAMFECGGSNRNPLFHVPAAAILAFSIAKYNWNYVSDPVPGLNGRTVGWGQGKVIGGSSSINAMIFTRGQASEYDRWRDLGCDGWGFSDILPLFRKLEAHQRGANAFHGEAGPIMVSKAQSSLPICDAFLAAAAQSGIPILDDLNGNAGEGFGYYDVNIGRGFRSSATSYLEPRQERRNLRIVPHCHVTRILFESGRAVGIETFRDGVIATIRARREIIICGGSVNSPQLLMLSGIGPAAQLKDHGIPVLRDASEVGRNLSNHATVKLIFGCEKRATSFNYMYPGAGAGALARYAFTRSGYLAEGLIPVGGFYRSDIALEAPDMQLSLVPSITPPQWKGLRSLIPRRQGFTIVVNQGMPFSTGEVTLRSGDPLARAAIQANYFSDPRDIQVVTKGLKRVWPIFNQPGLAPYISEILAPLGGLAGDDADIEGFIRATAGSNAHPLGTCRMGADEKSVVDPKLRVRGVEGLRVADASIMPTGLNANPHASVLMIGEKAAELISKGS